MWQILPARSIALALLWLSCMAISEAQSDTPVAVAFPTQEGYFVAQYDSAATGWSVHALGSDVLHGRLDIHAIMPTWSPSGDALYTNHITQQDDERLIASAIYRYDTATDETTLFSEPFTPDSVLPFVEGIQFGDFSPDGRYLWAYRMVANQQSYLLDTFQGEIVFTIDGWYKTLSWEQRLIRTTYSSMRFPEIASTPQIVQLDASWSGERLAEQNYPAEPAWIWRSAALLPDGQLIVEADDDTVRTLDWDAAVNTGDVLGEGQNLQLQYDDAGNIRQLAYQTLDGAVFVVDPSTREQIRIHSGITDYTQQRILRWGFTDAGLVVIEENTLDDTTIHIAYVLFDGISTTITTLYEGNPIGEPQVSLTIPAVALRERLFDGETTTFALAVYVENSEVFAETFSQESAPAFVFHGDSWLAIDHRHSVTPDLITTATLIDLATQTTHTLPQPDTRLVTVSPDDAWLLYSCALPDLYGDGFVAGLSAYHPVSENNVSLLSCAEHPYRLLDSVPNFLWTIGD